MLIRTSQDANNTAKESIELSKDPIGYTQTQAEKYLNQDPKVQAEQAGALALTTVVLIDTANSMSTPKELGTSEVSPTAQKIADGHSYPKHVEGLNNKWGKEYGSLFQNSDQFAEYLDSVMKNPSAKFTGGGKTLYWDDRLGTIIIDNPQNPTAFRPQAGKAYYDEQVRELSKK
jgi:hypothetical protein